MASHYLSCIQLRNHVKLVSQAVTGCQTYINIKSINTLNHVIESECPFSTGSAKGQKLMTWSRVLTRPPSTRSGMQPQKCQVGWKSFAGHWRKLLTWTRFQIVQEQTNECTRTGIVAADHMGIACYFPSQLTNVALQGINVAFLLHTESGEWWHPAVRHWLFLRAICIHLLNTLKSNEQHTSWACPWHPPTLLGSQESTLTSASDFPPVVIFFGITGHANISLGISQNFSNHLVKYHQIPLCYWIIYILNSIPPLFRVSVAIVGRS